MWKHPPLQAPCRVPAQELIGHSSDEWGTAAPEGSAIVFLITSHVDSHVTGSWRPGLCPWVPPSVHLLEPMQRVLNFSF